MSGPSDRLALSVALVKRLIAAQFPHWAELPIIPIEPGGWDHHTYRLGRDMLVRLPSAARYAAQVEKEQQWLPRLADAGLPLHIPAPLAKGEPAAEIGYPFTWSVYRWIEGECASPYKLSDLPHFARDVAGFLCALHEIDAANGPAPGAHSFFRGGSLHVYDDETRRALKTLRGAIDTEAARRVWAAALESAWTKPPVWVHGDVAASNLLVRDDRLYAVIDFGCMSVGDPCCDLVMAWTFFDSESRRAFRTAMELDEATWRRARGWALWKALITLAGQTKAPAGTQVRARHELTCVLSDRTV